MTDIIFRKLIVPRHHLLRGEEETYGTTYAQEYLERFKPEIIAWLNDNAIVWSWHVSVDRDIADVFGVGSIKEDLSPVDRINVYFRFASPSDAMMYKLTW